MHKKLKILFYRSLPALIVVAIILPVLIFCISKLNRVDEKISLIHSRLEETNSDFDRLMSLVYNDGDIDNTSLYENHKLDYTVYSNGHTVYLYRRPEDIDDEIIYTIQQGDEVKVTNIVTCFYNNETYAKATVYNSYSKAYHTGFVKLSLNPYKDGQFAKADSTKYGASNYYYGNLFDVLSIAPQEVYVVATKIRELPRENAYVSYTTTGGTFEATAVSSDFLWVYIRTQEKNLGWVPKSDLRTAHNNIESFGRQIHTPIDEVYEAICGKSLGNEQTIIVN